MFPRLQLPGILKAISLLAEQRLWLSHVLPVYRGKCLHLLSPLYCFLKLSPAPFPRLQILFFPLCLFLDPFFPSKRAVLLGPGQEGEPLWQRPQCQANFGRTFAYICIQLASQQDD